MDILWSNSSNFLGVSHSLLNHLLPYGNIATVVASAMDANCSGRKWPRWLRAKIVAAKEPPLVNSGRGR
jgi:hypothetical protein